MTNRHNTTIETQGAVLRLNPNTISYQDISLAGKIVSGPIADYSKWFSSSAVSDYQMAIAASFLTVKNELANEPHSRRLVVTGPPGACWIATQFLSLAHGGYHVIGFYRSLDKDHLWVDAAFQVVLGNTLTAGKVKDLTLVIGSYHSYNGVIV